MPKIIENLEDRLIAEAKDQIEQNGYGAVTIRSIAKGCGVGVGTVYNYFPSKEALIATHLLEDWKSCVTAIESAASHAQSPQPVVVCICDQLRGFACRHKAIFRDKAAATSFADSFSRYHGILRDQLATPLRQFCDSDFTAQFIAESLLVWTMAGKPADALYEIVEKLF